MLPSLLCVLLGWPPFQLLNARDKCKRWRATPSTFLWIGIRWLDSLLADAQWCLAHAGAFWLAKALTVFPLSAQTTFFMKPSCCRDCWSSASLGWTQLRGLKFIGRRNTHARSSQARNCNLLSLVGVFHLQPAHNPNSFFLQPAIPLLTSKQKKTLKAGCDWGMVPTDCGQQGVMPQTAPHSTMLVCIVSRCLLEIMHSQLHGKQKPMERLMDFSVLLIRLVNHSDYLFKLSFIVPFILSLRQEMDVIVSVPGCHANSGHWAFWCTL